MQRRASAFKWTAGVSVAAALAIGTALAAEPLKSYWRVHQGEVGTLYFATGVVSTKGYSSYSEAWDPARRRGFIKLSDGEAFRPPKQGEYCIAATHYLEGAPSRKRYFYNVVRTKVYKNGDRITSQWKNGRPYRITPDSGSAKFPSFCTRGSSSMDKIILRFEFNSPYISDRTVTLDLQ